jgi:RNA polymerase sigma-70 factor, ECF subfamily
VNTQPRTGDVIYLEPFHDDRALAEALAEGNAAARVVLFDRYGRHVRRVLGRVLGHDPELADLLQEVFARAFSGVAQLRDGAKLKGWLTSVAVFTARGAIRARQRGRWLGFRAPDQLPEAEAVTASPEVLEALRSVYSVLEKLPVDERIAFALRHLDQMELTEVARAATVSLATIKRRLARAERRFARLAHHHEALAPWVARHPRWKDM